jgi:signal peptidase I, bacterial type
MQKFRFSSQQGSSYLRRIVKWIVDIVVVAILAVFVVKNITISTVMEGNSMAPVLLTEDSILINGIKYLFFEPQRHDIIAFKQGEPSKIYIKRIVGLPGETVQILNNNLYINGELLEFDLYTTISPEGIASQKVTLGVDEYFVLGDNPKGSEDSRFESVGNIKKRNIVGEVWFRTAPFDELGFID